MPIAILPTVIRNLAASALILAVSVSHAGAVGLGPLSESGLTNSDRKGFFLTLINPYPAQEKFRLSAVAWADETPETRVLLPLSEVTLGPKAQRRVLVIDTGLVPGEEHQFRVCAQRVDQSQETMVHARVCSKLTARRVS